MSKEKGKTQAAYAFSTSSNGLRLGKVRCCRILQTPDLLRLYFDWYGRSGQGRLLCQVSGFGRIRYEILGYSECMCDIRNDDREFCYNILQPLGYESLAFCGSFGAHCYLFAQTSIRITKVIPEE